jgi:hypothetical protein
MKIEAHRKILLVAILTLLFVPLLAHTAHGDNSISEFKLTAGINSVEFDQFGYSVDISDGTAVVGAPFADSVYVFQYDESASAWSEEAVLTAPVPAENELFGWSVAIDGDTVVVGTLNLSSFIGSAYLFTRSGGVWNEGHQLLTSGPGIGASVAISGDTLVVGAVVNSPSAYVFRYVSDDSMGTWGWVPEKQLKAPTGAPFFGWAVDLSGDTVVVGSPLPGSAYAFTRNGDSWDEGQELITGIPWVGSSVAIDGETVVVGAPTLLPVISQVPQDPGFAYVFRKDAYGSWQQQELPNPGVDGFGASVAISGDRLLVGTPTDDVACPDDPFCNSGSVQMFYFDGENWIQDPHHPTLIPKLEPSPEKYDEFGWALAIDGSRIAVGARFGDAFAGEPPDAPITKDAGSASVFILASPNQPPTVIEAIADPEEAKEGEVVHLLGSAEDQDGDPLIYNWVQIAGPEVDLGVDMVLAANDETNQAVRTFVAPELSEGCDKLTFQLTVTEDVDGGLSSEPVTVDIRVVPNNTIHSKLERRHRHWLYWHKYTFEGVKDQEVTLTLQADPDGLYRGKRATLMLKDKIRGARLYKRNRGELPNTITATLPADGEYVVYVVKQPWFCRGRNFRGDYILTLEGTCGKLKGTFRFKSDKCKRR